MGNTREGTARREIGNALCPEEIRRSLLDPCKDLVPPTAFASQDGLLLFPSIFFGWEISCPGGFLRETGNSGRNPGLNDVGARREIQAVSRMILGQDAQCVPDQGSRLTTGAVP